MISRYQNKLFVFANTLQEDLRDGRISREQFSFLLGVFLKKELGSFLTQELNSLFPSEDSPRGVSLVSYRKNRRFDYVNATRS